MPKTKEKTRQIEMYVGISNGDSAGSWTTDYVDIPADTPEAKIKRVAEAAFRMALVKAGTDNVAFVGVYSTPDVEEDEETCRKCKAKYPYAGDGWNGLCPNCADKAEAKRGKDEK